MKKIFYFMLSALVMLTASCSEKFDFNKEIRRDYAFMVNTYGSEIDYLGTDVELNDNLSNLSRNDVRIERFASYYRLDSAIFVITRTLEEDGVPEDLITDDDFGNVISFGPDYATISFKDVLKKIYSSDVVRPESNHLALRWVDGEDNPQYVFGNLEVGIVSVDAIDGNLVTMYPEPETDDEDVEFFCEDCEETEACEDCDNAVEE